MLTKTSSMGNKTVVIRKEKNDTENDYKYEPFDMYQEEHDTTAISADDVKLPRYPTKGALQRDRLLRLKIESRVSKMELRHLHRDTITIVHGYCRSIPSIEYEQIPLDILNLLTDFVGDYFAKRKMEQRSTEIIEFVNGNANKELMSYDHNDENPYIRPFVGPPLGQIYCLIIFGACICSPCLIVVGILYLLTCGFCCGRLTDCIEDECC